MNNENFLIEEIDFIPAREICRYIENPEIRNRATANSTAALIAKKYFEECDIDTNTGLHNVAQVLEDIELSDIYINDNYIDVRLYFNDNELCVPKSHFDRNILPAAYMFIKLNEDLTGGLVTGFITPNTINTENEINGYYPVKEEDLISYYDVETFLIHKDEIDLTPELEANVFDYLDNKLEDTNAFYRELIESRELRKKLIQAAKAKIVFNFVSVSEPADSVISNDSEQVEANDFVDLIEESGDLELDIDMSASDEIEDLTEIQEEDELQSIEELDSPLEENMIEEDISLEEDSIEHPDNEDLVEEELTSEESPIIETGDFSNEDDEIIPLEGFVSDEEEENTVPIEDYSPAGLEVEEPIEIQENIIAEKEETLEDAALEENEFSTSTTPSLESYTNLEENTTDLSELLDNNEEETNDSAENSEEDNSPQIDTLFNNDNETENIEEDFIKPQKKKSLLLPVLGTAVILAAAGYFGYTKFMPAPPQPDDMQDTNATEVLNREETTVNQEPEAMPLETVENTTKPVAVNEGNSVSIPAIEQNLDASILVSNLSVKWEVPAAYSSNAAAKRYFTKMGKIIQLNLKTELLLLNKPPITNKIALELEYNKGANKFQIKGITASSGEETVDEVITKTVRNALDMNLNINMGSFGNIQGNPVLIISL